MNIKITHNWLLDFIETDATPSEIQKYLSLCGPSIERVDKTETGDYVYDIEITSNRIDSASVFGIALECVAILPLFGKKAKLKFNPLETYSLSTIKTSPKKGLEVKLESEDLCSRFTALTLDIASVKQSPSFIQERLSAVGIKVINAVVDISNYLMVTLGQPSHMFNLDGIGKQTMTMRKSKRGEKLTTLDEKPLTLPGGDIVIEDGNGTLIDLCGIMGGLNSSFTDTTKQIVFFVQTYNKQLIRKTSMLTGQRTLAATYFEKGLDEERVAATLGYGVSLLTQYADATVSSNLIDIYPKKYKPLTIDFTQSDIDKRIGVVIPEEKILHILNSLGFSTTKKNQAFHTVVPSFRQYDVSIVEDIVEEIARVYGYHNLPNKLSPACYVKQPPEMEQLFVYQSRIKYFLKHLGLNEVLNYSMISKEMAEHTGFNTNDMLCLANVLSEEIKYLRTSLLPSLIKNIKSNEGKKEKLALFELAKVYPPKQGDLPTETYKLALATTQGFNYVKGVIETLAEELHIEASSFRISDNRLFEEQMQVDWFIGDTKVGTIGKLNYQYKEKSALKSDCFLAELDFTTIINNARTISTYKPPHPYAVVKLDSTIETSAEKPFEQVKQTAFKVSSLLSKIEVISVYQGKATLRFYFSSFDRNITEKQAKEELQKILA